MANPQHSQRDQLGMVAEFCKAMGQPVSQGWQGNGEGLRLRHRLIKEEAEEVFSAVTDKLFSDATSQLAYLSAPMFEDQRMSAGAIFLYMRLVLLAGKKDCCCPSQTALATACKMSIRSVKAHIRKLVNFGYIQIVSATEGAESCEH